jgi:membrane protein implicated in regulation of membrane protease activity
MIGAMSKPERVVLAVFLAAAAILAVVGAIASLSPQLTGSVFIALVVVGTAIGATVAPRERPHR